MLLASLNRRTSSVLPMTTLLQSQWALLSSSTSSLSRFTSRASSASSSRSPRATSRAPEQRDRDTRAPRAERATESAPRRSSSPAFSRAPTDDRSAAPSRSSRYPPSYHNDTPRSQAVPPLSSSPRPPSARRTPTLSSSPSTLIITREEEGVRLDRVLREASPNQRVPHSLLHKLIRERRVRVWAGKTGERLTGLSGATRLEVGDRVELPRSWSADEFEEAPATMSVATSSARTRDRTAAAASPRPPGAPSSSAPSSSPSTSSTAPTPSPPPPALLEAVRDAELYRDEHVIVLNKPPGLATQDGTGVPWSVDSLATTALGLHEPLRLTHRLDRETSGALILARTRAAARALSLQFAERTVEKVYWALVRGVPGEREGVIDAPLPARTDGRRGAAASADVRAAREARAAALESARLAANASELGRAANDGEVDHTERELDGEGDSEQLESTDARTAYRVLRVGRLPSAAGGAGARGEVFSWLELTPHTGRKHQLRRHCADELECPIVGDLLYGRHSGRQRWLKQNQPWVWRRNRRAGDGDRVIPSMPEALHLHCRSMRFWVPRADAVEALAAAHARLPGHVRMHPSAKFAGSTSSSRHTDAEWDPATGEWITVHTTLPAHMSASWALLGWPEEDVPRATPAASVSSSAASPQ